MAASRLFLELVSGANVGQELIVEELQIMIVKHRSVGFNFVLR